MIFNFKEVKCTLDVLKMIKVKGSRYSTMFKETGVSHTTLQKVLEDLLEGKFICRRNMEHTDVGYDITEKGRKLLQLLVQLENIIK